ncbi:AbrB/MazE/SpoVT family DNA-binding domain-containing protein [Candidatus Pacearchaeota archaeon]|nr:AbrB/MazE/SpoVT family DNA-binding domain-containing protein [Candidatus Pacearchaeota archaeon]
MVGELKKSFFVKLTKWGLNLGLRIPKELVRKYQLAANEEVKILKTKEGFEVRKVKAIEGSDNYSI